MMNLFAQNSNRSVLNLLIQYGKNNASGYILWIFMLNITIKANVIILIVNNVDVCLRYLLVFVDT
jgi:hypothetical protein